MKQVAFWGLALLLAAAAAHVTAQENSTQQPNSATLTVVDNPDRSTDTLHNEVNEYYLLSKRDCSDFPSRDSASSRKSQLGRQVENAVTPGHEVFLYGHAVTTHLLINKDYCAGFVKFTPEAGHKYEAHHRWGDEHSNAGCSIQVVDKATGAPPPSLERVPITGACNRLLPWNGGTSKTDIFDY